MPNAIFGAMGKCWRLIHLMTGISITSVAPDFQVEVRPQASKSETLAGASIGLGLRAGTGGAHLELQFPHSSENRIPQNPMAYHHSP